MDTKTSNDVVDPAEVTIRDTHAWGFRGGLIGNMAAFNLKENVRVHLDQVTVNNSEIAFRLRGQTDSRPRGAQVTMSNTLIYDVDTAVRYEDRIDVVRMDNITVGGDIGRAFQNVSENGRIEGRNVLFLGEALPEEINGGSNLAVDASCFIDRAQNDYHLSAGCAAIDAGEDLGENDTDRSGVSRPKGSGWDVGAHEYCEGDCGDVPDPEPMPDSGVVADAGTDAGLGSDMGEETDQMSMAPTDSAVMTGIDGAMSQDGSIGQGAGTTASESSGGGCASMFGSPTNNMVWITLVGLLVFGRRRSHRDSA